MTPALGLKSSRLDYTSTLLELSATRAASSDFTMIGFSASQGIDSIFSVQGDGMVNFQSITVKTGGQSILAGGIKVVRGGMSVLSDGMHVASSSFLCSSGKES